MYVCKSVFEVLDKADYKLRVLKSRKSRCLRKFYLK